MRNIAKVGLVALALTGGALLSTGEAMADNVTVGVSSNGIAFGYSDGYWDREQKWHNWRNEQEAARWRRGNREHYFDRKHNDEHDEGWRDHDRWWQHR